MKRLFKINCLVGSLLFVFSLYATSAAAITLELLPGTQTGGLGDLVSLDLRVSGLGDFAPDSLGDFDVDVAYDPAVLALTGFVLGEFLGNFTLGEALDFSLGDLGGAVNLAVLSLLEPDAGSCVFCVVPYLDDIQPDSFSLATLEFRIDSLAPGAATIVGIDTANALGDGFGVPLTLDSTSDAVIRRAAGGTVPEPATLVMLLAGLGAVRLLRNSPRGSV